MKVFQGVSRMKRVFAHVAFMACVILFAGCAPKVDETEAAAGTSAAEQPVESAAAPALQAIPGKQVLLLSNVVDIPFEHKQVFDRVREGAGGTKERQIGLTSSVADHKAVAGQLEAALKQAGFQTKTTENKDGWVWITVIANAGKGKAKIAIRPEKNKPGTVVVFKAPEA